MAIVGAVEEHVDPTLSRIAQDDKKIWYKKPNLRFLYLILIPTGLGVEWTSGFDSSMMNSLQAVESWFEYFGRPNASRLGLLNAMYSLGALMAIPFVPFVSQRIGRRRTILFGSYIMILGAGLQAGARNVDMFLASRWVLGFGIPFAIINASSLIGELSYAKERPIMTRFVFLTSFKPNVVVADLDDDDVVFSMLVGSLGTFQMSSTWAWRIPSLLQLVPSGCQIVFMPFCPESPRWLISKDRGDEAYAILHKYHSEGENGGEFVRLEYAQIMSTIQQEKEVASKFAWADVFRDAAMRRRFMLAAIMGFFTQWSGNGLLSFYMKSILNLVGITDNRTVQKVILSNTCWGLINAVPIALIAPRFARRKMFLVCTIGTAAVYTVWTIASARFAIENSQRAAIPVLVFIFVYSPFYNIGWNALAYTYLVELFPFSQRAKGIAVEQLTVRFAVFFNTYVNPIALDSIGWKYYIVYCVWILVEIATVYMIFPETQGRTLEELSFMFEGKEIQDKVQKNTQKVLQVELEDIGARSRPRSLDAPPEAKV
ncbi:MFS sugar transporter [Colletotrichum incanum]|nr:MFS sugar transporter [Colletotrichum incanum]